MVVRVIGAAPGMNIDFSDPQALIGILAPIWILLTGLGFFFFPARVMKHLKLEGVAQHPEAIGEARSSFAGFLIAAGILALTVKLPVIMLAVSASLAIAAAGKLVHIVFDGPRQASVYIRFVIIALLALICFLQVEMPVRSFTLPATLGEILPAISAVVTIVFGLICFFAPVTALHLMRLRPGDAFPEAKGEVRGLLAGFYLGVGLTVLLIGGYYSFLLLALAWAATAFGRIISMLSDGTNNVFNWVSLMLELVLVILPLSVVLGLTG